MKRLKIEIKGYQYVDINGNNVVLFTDPLTGVVSFQLGTNPTGFDYWRDVTDSVDRLESNSISWDTGTETNTAPSNRKRGTVGAGESLIFTKTTGVNSASYLLEQWILNNNSHGIWNKFLVKISYLAENGNYYAFPLFELKYEGVSNQVTAPENGTYKVVVREYTETKDLLDRFIITSSVEGFTDYFSESSTFQHPRMVYAHRSKSAAKTYFYLFAVFFSATIIFNFLFLIPGFTKFIFRTIFGTGRAHPAPLIRTYLDNICNKTGLTLDTTAFDTLTGFGSVFGSSASPYYNEVFMCGNAKRGIDIDNTAATDYFIRENSPLLTATEFITKICGLHCLDWAIHDNILYIGRIDYLRSINPVTLDLTDLDVRKRVTNTSDYQYVLPQSFATLSFKYGSDSQDSAGNEYKPKYNDNVSLVAYDSTFIEVENTPYRGIREFTFDDFAPVASSEDYEAGNYLSKADYIGDILNSAFAFIIGGIFWTQMYNFWQTEPEANNYMILDSETFDKYKVMIWDNTSGFDSARIRNDYDPLTPNPNYQPVSWYLFNSVNFPLTFNSAYENNIFSYFGKIYDSRYNPHKKKDISITFSHVDLYDTLNALGMFSITNNFPPNLLTLKLPDGEIVAIKNVNISFAKCEIELKCTTLT